MAKCTHCGSKVGGLFKPKEEGVAVVKISILRFYYCSENCLEAYRANIGKLDPKTEERNRIREERQIQRNKLREEGKL